MTDLTSKKCVSHNKMTLLSKEEIMGYLSQLKEGWVFEVAKIKKLFNFGDFKEAMEFVSKVAVIAEQEGHHPDITIHYNKVEIVLWSHFVNGLSINDFILAAKIDKI